jgi:hypothetical protein
LDVLTCLDVLFGCVNIQKVCETQMDVIHSQHTLKGYVKPTLKFGCIHIQSAQAQA